MRYTIILLLFIASPLLAQDSAKTVCDSVTIAQSNEIVRLQGEVNKERAMKNLLLQISEGKDSTTARDKRNDALKTDKEIQIIRTDEAYLLGLNVILLIALLTYIRIK